jgi:hypothetical protein
VKPNCVADDLSWLREGEVYRGRVMNGEVQTVQLWSPDGQDFIEVLRGSVVRLNEIGAAA